MATSVTANGQSTSVPGVIATPKFATAGRALPQAKVLAIVGEFEEIANDAPQEFTNAAAMMAAAPGNEFVEQMAGIAFNAASDSRVGSPQSVILASTLPSIAAEAQLLDTYGKLSVTLESRVSGQGGNQLAYTLVDGTDAQNKNLTILKLGESEALTALGSGPVLRVGYTDGCTYADKITLSAIAPIYDAQLGDVTGEINLVMHKSVTAVIGVGVTTTVDATDKTADSKVTFDPASAVNAAYTALLTPTAVTLTDAGDVVETVGANSLAVGDKVTIATVVGSNLAPGTYWVYGINSPTAFTLGATVDAVAAQTFTGPGTATAVLVPVSALITGVDSNGAATTETVTFTTSQSGAQQSTKSWSRIDSIAISGGSFAAAIGISWTIKRITRSSASTLKAVAALLGDLPHIDCAIKNPRAATLTLGDLDTLPSTDIVAANVDLRCDAAEFTRLVNNRSRYATATRDLPSTATERTSQGACSGTAGAAVLTVTSGAVAGDVIVVCKDSDGLHPFYVGIVLTAGGTLTMSANFPVSFSGQTAFLLSVNPNKPVVATGTTARVFAGGSTGVTGANSRTAMYDELALTQTAIIACMSTDEADILAAYNHAVTMSGIGARECCVFAAADEGLSLADLDTLSLAYNSRHIAFASEAIRVVDTRGLRRWLDPRFQGLQVAAMQAGLGIGEPVTTKRPRVVDTRSGNANWNGTKNANDLINAGVIAYSRDALGFKVTRGITSYRASDDVNQTELSSNESVNWQIRDMRDEVLQVIGSNSATFYPDALIGIVIARGRKQVDGKLITAFYPDSVYLTRNGDTIIIGYDFEPAVPNNFVVLVPSVRPVSFTFTLT